MNFGSPAVHDSRSSPSLGVSKRARAFLTTSIKTLASCIQTCIVWSSRSGGFSPKHCLHSWIGVIMDVNGPNRTGNPELGEHRTRGFLYTTQRHCLTVSTLFRIRLWWFSCWRVARRCVLRLRVGTERVWNGRSFRSCGHRVWVWLPQQST